MNTTIFAPATLVGSSGITVIRISGDETFGLLEKIFSKSSEEFEPVDLHKLSSHTAHHGYIFNNGELIDEAVVTVFRAPNSYTGEDVAEISTHGGSYIYRKISYLLRSSGCIHAVPGEFSRRAYLNGKMDLAQAEAVADLIKAKTDQANGLALRQLTGRFSGKIKSLREELINYCSLLELELDFSEEGIDLVSKDNLLAKVDKLIEKFKDLTRTYERGKIILNGVNLAIIGKPNVGKSSIFNYFLNESRAIVSEFPGTTRDYLQEPLVMDGIQYNLIDTAGIRLTEDVVEKEGVRRSRVKIEESDLILEVVDLTNPDPNADNSIKDVSREKVVKVYNKVDIAPGGEAPSDGISISAITGEGMDKLHKAINEKASALTMGSETSDIIITNERHRDCLLKSCEYLSGARDQILSGGGNELISFEIRAAMDSISEIIGKTANVDILNNIFTKFCIGK